MVPTSPKSPAIQFLYFINISIKYKYLKFITVFENPANQIHKGYPLFYYGKHTGVLENLITKTLT